MEPLVMKGDRTSGAGEEKVRRSAAAPAELTSLVLTNFAIFCGACYLGFLSYVAVTYTNSWMELLRLLPLFIFSVTVPLMGAVMLRK